MNTLLAARISWKVMKVTTLNSMSIVMALMSLSLLLTIGKTKLARVLGSDFYPLWSVLSLMFYYFLAFSVHRFRTSRYFLLR